MKNFTVALILILFSKFAISQYIIKDGSDLLNLQKLPQEKIYVHHSAAIVFSGEYIYYKLYCQNAQNNRLSTISSNAYVGLINEFGDIVFEHKLRLDKGMATGDFFVNTDVPSGNYKLIAYTQWMKNSGLKQLFKDEIVVINPYLADQKRLLDSSGTIVSETHIAMAEPEIIDSENTELFELNTTENNFKKRQKVLLNLRNFKGKLAHGNYSVLVQKKNEFANLSSLTAEEYGNQYLDKDKSLNKSVGDSIFLPEQRGELFFGQIFDKKTQKPASDKNIIISVPGKEYLLKSAISGQDGYFYTYFKKDYKNPKVIVQVTDEGDYDVVVKKQKKLDFSTIEVSDFTLDKKYESAIKSRSIHNQIENSFFVVKPDSILPKDDIDVFDGGIPEVFHLDDYTRFPTLQETFVEILNTVGYRSGGDYIRVAQKFEKANIEYNDFPAIILIDGVFIPDHSKIRDFDANLIKTIKVLYDQLVLGSKQYQGLVVIETKNGDYFQNFKNENASVNDLKLPKIQKNYFKQQYASGDAQNRIPDYREILLWQPNITITESNFPIEFYTSDITGDYEIRLEGFTTYGKPVSLKKTIFVE